MIETYIINWMARMFFKFLVILSLSFQMFLVLSGPSSLAARRYIRLTLSLTLVSEVFFIFVLAFPDFASPLGSRLISPRFLATKDQSCTLLMEKITSAVRSALSLGPRNVCLLLNGSQRFPWAEVVKVSLCIGSTGATETSYICLKFLFLK